jgi:glycosyltransferase involved in cell wall biosynthesis
MKLLRDGHDVTNFYLKHKKASFLQDGIQIFGDKRGGYLKNYFNIYKIIRQTNPDIILSNFSYVNPALLIGRLFGIKRNIVWFHTVYGHSRPSRLKVFIKKLFLKMADVVISNSKLLQDEVQIIYGLPKHKTCSIPFWTNISDYTSESDLLKIFNHETGINIGCPGRLVSDKNHIIVIEALHQLKQKHRKSIRLYVAGDGPYRGQLEKVVKDLHLDQDVVFLGVLGVKEMITFYEAMDVVVLPSLNEAFGLVFIEAIALGVPVLVSNAFGSLNYIDSHKFQLEDFSFNPHALEELIHKLEIYLENKGQTSDYFKRMYKETFDKEVIYNQIKSVILD